MLRRPAELKKTAQLMQIQAFVLVTDKKMSFSIKVSKNILHGFTLQKLQFIPSINRILHNKSYMDNCKRD